MNEKKVKEILKKIKENNEIVISKNVALWIEKEPRYTQGFLDALEGAKLIEFKSIGTMKIITITNKGAEFLEKAG